MVLLETKGITKSYDTGAVIRDISIHIEEGELVSLLGLSGSGKTTLLNVISGLTAPDSGKVFLKGEDITGCPGRISYMLQKDLLLQHRLVIDNVALPLIVKGMKKKEAREKVVQYFEQFGLSGTEYRYPAQLSGGMRQRAALLRTWMVSGEAALLDEPFSALDMITKGQMHEWYLEVMQRIRLSTLLITHDVDEAILLSDRIYLLTGTPGEITNEIAVPVPRAERTDFDLNPAFIECKQRIRSILREQT